MKSKLNFLRKPFFGLAALLLGVTGLLPVLGGGTAYAYGQVTTRSIQMSNSTPGASASYLVTFTPATSTTIQAIAVDFCSNSPIPGDSCTKPTGFSVGTPTVTGVTVAGQSAGTWTASQVNTNRTLELSNGSSTGTPSGAASFTLTTATNPSSTAGTFYARILTFSSTANMTTWNSTADGSATGTVLDFGGIALSTVNNVTVTAKVQETLTFCTSGAPISSGCGTTTTPSLNLGSTVGSNVILGTTTSTGSVYTQTSTNALSGVSVDMKNVSSTNCGGLSSNGGTSCAIAAAGAAITAIGNGSGKIGMCVTPGTANTTAQAPYNNNGCTSYGLDESTANNNVISTYGDQIFTSASAINQENDTLNFAAAAANTTPAGIYTANYALIATGKF